VDGNEHASGAGAPPAVAPAAGVAEAAAAGVALAGTPALASAASSASSDPAVLVLRCAARSPHLRTVKYAVENELQALPTPAAVVLCLHGGRRDLPEEAPIQPFNFMSGVLRLRRPSLPCDTFNAWTFG